MKHKITSLTLAATILLCVGTQAQNLVPNASFEKIDGKIKGNGAIEETGNWYSPTDEVAELFSPEAKLEELKTPSNLYGKENPKTGTNFAGIIAYSYKDKAPRSYLGTELISPLVENENYCVSFYASHADLSKYAVSKLGAILTKNEVNGASGMYIDNPDAITSEGGDPSSMTMYWDRICNDYKAKGGEKFITVGNFHNSKALTVKKVKTPPDFARSVQMPMAFYYIDDVEVTPISEGDMDCKCGIKNTGKAPVVVRQTASSKAEVHGELEDKIYGTIVAFKENSLEFDSEAEAIINSLVIQMQLEKEIKLICIGHTNKAEIKAGNGVLAGERAEKIFDLLQEKGISEERLKHRSGKEFERVGKPTDSNYEMENRSVIFEFF
ncbi:MAG: outer membrane protein OmpA-like peptidoglycan-associated protein [Sphingobacteriales bacterium]|jgi:outer membrane protein OmpA-like peptidoglycan-associated protein